MTKYRPATSAKADASGKLMQVDIQPDLKIYGQKQDLDELLVLLLENAVSKK